MHIIPTGYNTYNLNQIKSRNTSNLSQVNFTGTVQRLIPADTNSFETETAKKIYSQIQKYLKVIKTEGVIRNIKILDAQELQLPSDVFLSIDKKAQDCKLILSQKSNCSNDFVSLLEAKFNEHGQMITGSFPGRQLSFSRTSRNVRRILDPYTTHRPYGGNDKEWGAYAVKMIGSSRPLMESANDGAYEIFMELSRLYTSIYK